MSEPSAAFLPGQHVRIIDITPDPDMDEDDLDLIHNMIGSVCEIDRIDEDGLLWVSVWWNDFGSTFATSVGLTPDQVERLAGAPD